MVLQCQHLKFASQCLELISHESAPWPGPEYHDRPAGGIYEPVLRTRCAKSSRLPGTLAGLSVSPVVLACLPVAGPIVDLRLGAGRAAPWVVSVPNRCPTKRHYCRYAPRRPSDTCILRCGSRLASRQPAASRDTRQASPAGLFAHPSTTLGSLIRPATEREISVR